MLTVRHGAQTLILISSSPGNVTLHWSRVRDVMRIGIEIKRTARGMTHQMVWKGSLTVSTPERVVATILSQGGKVWRLVARKEAMVGP